MTAAVILFLCGVGIGALGGYRWGWLDAYDKGRRDTLDGSYVRGLVRFRSGTLDRDESELP